MSSKKTDSPAKSVHRVLDIFETLANNGSMSLAQISEKQEMNKSTAHYTLQALVERRYLRRDPATKRYELGLQLLSLSHDILNTEKIKAASDKPLKELYNRSEKVMGSKPLATHVAVLDHGEAVYVNKYKDPQPGNAASLVVNTRLGQRLPVHAVAVGKVILANLPESEAEAIIEMRHLKKLTSKTTTDPVKFLAYLRSVKKKGYAVDDEENCIGVVCVAAPILTPGGLPIASVSVTGTAKQMERYEEALGKLVKKAAREVLKWFDA